jgi:uncharacterized protein YbaR (Trm112 family)
MSRCPYTRADLDYDREAEPPCLECRRCGGCFSDMNEVRNLCPDDGAEDDVDD